MRSERLDKQKPRHVGGTRRGSFSCAPLVESWEKDAHITSYRAERSLKDEGHLRATARWRTGGKALLNVPFPTRTIRHDGYATHLVGHELRQVQSRGVRKLCDRRHCNAGEGGLFGLPSPPHEAVELPQFLQDLS